MAITLTTEQEKFIQQQLETGKYSSINEVITKAFSLLANEETSQEYVIQTGELAQKKLLEKVAMVKKLIAKNKNKSVDLENEKLAEKLRDLFERTQAISSIQDITEEEIALEIEDYRRGE